MVLVVDAMIVRGREGPPGPAAVVGVSFTWHGVLQSSEPAQGFAMPTAGVFNPANFVGNCDVAPSADATFTLAIDGVGAGSVTFHAGVKVPTLVLTTTAYGKGSYVKAMPPASPDASLSGPSFALLN